MTASKSSDISTTYTLGECLGSGQFGRVYLAEHKATLSLCVCKTMDSVPGCSDDAHVEAEALCLVDDHFNIVKLLNRFNDGFHQMLIMELCPYGDLFDHITKIQTLREESAALIILQMAHALRHCHGRNVLHRDVKPENILISEWGRSSVTGRKFPIVKLADFGSALILSEKEEQSPADCVGTLMYMAPELLAGSGAPSASVDTWSLGVVLFACLAGSLPFHGNSKSAVLRSIQKRRLRFRHRVSPEAIDLLVWMLELDPKDRPSMEDVLCHEWILQHSLAMDVDVKSNCEMFLHGVHEYFQEALEADSPSSTSSNKSQSF